MSEEIWVIIAPDKYPGLCSNSNPGFFSCPECSKMAAKRPASPTRVGCHSHNLRHKRNLTPIVSSAKHHRDPCSGPSTDSKELREVRFGFPFNQIGQSNNGFFNRPIMARTQILVHSWGTEQGFWSWLADGLKKWFSFVCGASYHQLYHLQSVEILTRAS